MLLLRSGESADRRKLVPYFRWRRSAETPIHQIPLVAPERSEDESEGGRVDGFVANCPFVEPGFLGEYGLVEKAPHDHTNYKLESSNFAARVAQYQNSLVNRCI